MFGKVLWCIRLLHLTWFREQVRELIGQYPALSPLALVLKQFLTDRSLDHPYTGGLSSYCLVSCKL